MSEPQAPEIDIPAEPADGQPEPEQQDTPYQFKHVVKEPVPGAHAGYVVHLKEPTEAQLFVLLRMVDMVGDNPLGAVRLYGDAIEELMPTEESHRLQRGLLKGHLEPEDFINVGPACIRHYFPELNVQSEPEADKGGPKATRRPKKRR